jgi:hypothetical protein
MNDQRQIFLHGPLGRRQFREVLGGVMAGLLLRPEPIWLVSPWLSDFPVLDNCSGQWDALEPGWGSREVSFNEVLARAINGGCRLRLVTRDDVYSRRFIQQLSDRLVADQDFRYQLSDRVHTKGLLTKNCFLKGSMNYTWSGTNRNDEHVMLTNNPQIISEALLEFEEYYRFEAFL